MVAMVTPVINATIDFTYHGYQRFLVAHIKLTGQEVYQFVTSVMLRPTGKTGIDFWWGHKLSVYFRVKADFLWNFHPMSSGSSFPKAKAAGGLKLIIPNHFQSYEGVQPHHHDPHTSSCGVQLSTGHILFLIGNQAKYSVMY
jgi:hypothetical protein